ncbi:MAG: hypothetical protein Q4B10_07000 [Actinomycetaceae bacterium]|nr:hypothetical protein [Actinomycetaceae bacterium]
MKSIVKAVTAGAIVAAACFPFTDATPAQAAPACQKGWVCMWEGTNASSRSHIYSSSANHSHPIGSVYFNYARMGTKFWTNINGSGEVIVYYRKGETGFRNWSKNNWFRCKSHWDVSR